ncbi:MAG: CHAP domain-containing protein [Sandaracinaceae bacterium]|nr:CHAP domain-containing protein [Sandaracinaceae bacterium]
MGRALPSLLLGLCVAATARAQPDACAEVTCSGHGECMLEDREPLCFCEEGYAAEGLRCVRAAPSPADERARRSSSIGARIVMIASAEGGRWLPGVGRDLAEYPGRLAQYLKPGGLWCSEFVSWVYRAAGVPFTSGYEGGWLLTTNVAVERWFARAGRWIANGTAAWARFSPRPGDYLRFRTDRHGHSGIVRYVAGDTLYTVEGNSRGQVRLRRYPRFRDNPRIAGFGVVTLPDARVASSAGRDLDPPAARP